MALLGAITVDSVRAANLTKHKYMPAEALFEYTEGDSMVNDPQYIQDSPAGYSNLQLESQITKKHKTKKNNTDANWDDEGEENMDEEEFKADSPEGYNDTTDTRIKNRRHGHSHHHQPRAHMQRKKVDWTEEHAQHMDEEEFEKDAPAGYKVEEEKAAEPSPAPA